MAGIRTYVQGIGIIASLVVAAVPAIAQSGGDKGAQTPPSAPVTVVNTPANPVPVAGSFELTAPVAVTQSGAWMVQTTDPFAPGATATRFGPTDVTAFPSGTGQIVPPVPAGKVFILKYVNAIGASNVGPTAADARCWLRLQRGGSSLNGGSIPLRMNLGMFVASEQMFFPLSAGESLAVFCDVTPTISTSFNFIVGGHFVPAAASAN